MVALAVACSGGGDPPGSETGGAGSGGKRDATGGVMATGGSQATGGGATGGSAGTGGATGGKATGGATPVTGGSGPTGGTSSGGAGGKGTGGATGGRGGAGTGGLAMGGAGTGGASSPGGRGGSSGPDDPALAKFSFFVVSQQSMVALSGKAVGFGGNLTFGKSDGLAGADEICRQAAERGLAGAGRKQWRAFLSVTAGPDGKPVNGRDRIGTGPWYDRLGRLVASDLTSLFAGERPGGDSAVANDLPNERGEPNHYVGAAGLGAMTVDNHDTLTGSDTMGRLRATSAADTCNDWTSTTASGRPWVGHSWPRSPSNGRQWASDHQAPGCTAGVDVTLGGTGSGSCVGCAGGYGGIFCFALP